MATNESAERFAYTQQEDLYASRVYFTIEIGYVCRCYLRRYLIVTSSAGSTAKIEERAASRASASVEQRAGAGGVGLIFSNDTRLLFTGQTPPAGPYTRPTVRPTETRKDAQLRPFLGIGVIASGASS